METLESPTRRKVKEMDAAGMNVRQIALALQISTQAVYKHKRALEEAAKPAEEAS